MKKVISGVLCDTETAKVLGEYEHEHKSSFHWYVERLYRTKSGKYFIYGEGHAASPYAKKVAQNEWTGGEKIQLLPPEAARQWAEENLSGDEYIAAFGEPEEDVQLGVTIRGSTRSKLDSVKAETGLTFGEIIDRLVAGETIDEIQKSR